jgi:Fe-S-cluster containining protein
VLRYPKPDDLNCRSCGACCCNSKANQAEGYAWYVPVDNPRSKLLSRDDWRKRYVVLDEEGQPHLRLEMAFRCAALTGKLGRNVTCQVYGDRPAGCRRVEAGDAECRRARTELGMATSPNPQIVRS